MTPMDKKQTKHRCTVAFHGLGEARIDDLTQEQAWQIYDVMRLIERQPPRYSERGHLLYHVTTELAGEGPAITVRGGFLARLMRRFSAWAMGGCVIIALLAGATAALAQDRKARAVEPIKIALVMDGAQPRGGEFDKLVRAELNKLRVAFVSDAPDYDLHFAMMKLDEASGGCAGFIAITLTVTRATGRYKLGVHTGPTLDAVARLAVEAIDKELWRK